MKKPQKKKAPSKGSTKKKIDDAIRKHEIERKMKIAAAALKKPKAAAPKKVNRTKPKTRRQRAVAPPPREIGLLDAIGEVIGDVEELGQEMRTWAENMEEKFGSTQKYIEVDEAADALEDIAGENPCNGDAREAFLNDIKITIQDPTPRRAAYSRAARLGNAEDVLRAVIDKLEDPALLVVADAPLTEEQKGVCDEYHSTLEEIEGSMQGVDFPGMY